MNVEINQEQVNDRAKLMMHRIVARQLGRDLGIMDRAREALAFLRQRSPGRDALSEWEDILSSSPRQVRRLLTERSERMDRLRLTSPFMFIEGLGLSDVPTRRRIWHLAKRGLVARHMSDATAEQDFCPKSRGG